MKFAAAGFAASTRAVLYGSAAVLSLTIPGVAFAQDAEAQPAVDQPADDAGEGNDIVVTATKREQTLQEVPVAVTVTTAEAIERAQIRDLKDLSTVVPSLRINQLQSPANTNFYIRGFGNGANNAGIEPSVGVFVDGVYRSRTAAQIGDLPDVQRIEVLRGPQSTLFGKNASAGVISIVTQKPQFNFGGNVEASYGNYNAITFKGVVTGPVSQDLAVSLAGGYNKRDGYVSDLGTGHKTSDRNRWFVRGQALYEPSNDLKIRLTADYGRIDEICCAVSNIRSSAATAVLKGLGGNANDPANPYGGVTYNNIDSTNDIKNYGVSGQIDYEMGPLTLTSITAWRKLEALSNQDSDFTSADLIGHNSQDLGIKTFTQELRLATNLDGPVNFLLGAFYFNEKVRQSNELVWGTAARPYANTLVGAASGGALSIPLLEGTFGALEGSPAKYVGQFFKVGAGLNERYRLDDEAFSIFGQIDFEVTDGLTLTGGVNYTKDRKTYSTNVISTDAFAGVDFNKSTYAPLRNQLLFQGGLAQQVGTLLGLGRSATAAEIGAFAGGNPAAFSAVSAGVAAFATANQNNPLANPLNGLKALQLLPPFLNVPNAVESGRTNDDKFTWTARLAYDVTDTVNVYLTYATGYKASSVNLTRDSRPLASDAAALTAAGLTVSNQTYGSRAAGPENSTVYEAGIKGNWGLASVNFAVFKQIIRGFQSNIFTGTGFFLANAGKQSSFGIEFEGMVKPAKGLTLSLGMTYLDPKYDEFKLSAFGDLSGTKPAGVAPISASFGLDYDHELGNGDHIMLHGDYHYESKFQQVEGLPGLVVRNTSTGAVVSTAAALAAAREFASEVNSVNASITYAMQNGLEVSIWGRNLLNDRYLNSVFDSPAQSGSLSGYPNQPLTWGGSIRFRW